jgi:hypothetical protein
VLLTRSPLEYLRRDLSVRLACVKHAASVRPEPESNSPNKNNPSRETGEFESEKSDLTKRHQKLASINCDHTRPRGVFRCGQKTTKNKNTKHTIEFSNNTLACFSARFGATLPA